MSVKSGSETDIKLSLEWSSNWYIYENDFIRKDATGNILFGYVGKFFGYDDKFLSAGAGAYQIYERHSDWSFWPTYFDDPYDNKMIYKGIEYYNKTH